MPLNEFQRIAILALDQMRSRTTDVLEHAGIDVTIDWVKHASVDQVKE